jgi:hypothetical protein
VIERARTLFPSTWTGPAPVGGLWLFDAPWEEVRAGTAQPADLIAINIARLKGFSLAQATTQGILNRAMFPAKYAAAVDYSATTVSHSHSPGSRASGSRTPRCFTRSRSVSPDR